MREARRKPALGQQHRFLLKVMKQTGSQCVCVAAACLSECLVGAHGTTRLCPEVPEYIRRNE